MGVAGTKGEGLSLSPPPSLRGVALSHLSNQMLELMSRQCKIVILVIIK